jgi:hypothetical protein
MGKRELVIILAFVLVGAVAYQLTAPPPKPGERSFSLSRIFSNIRDHVRSSAASATITRTGTIALREGITELRLTGLRVVPLTITGEPRSDIAYELWVRSDGPDEATAHDWAGRATVVDDDLGLAQSLAVTFPKEGNQTGRLTLRVPNQVLVRLEGAGPAGVTGVRAVDLRNLSGEATLKAIAGAVTGSHRAGELTVNGAAGVKLDLSASRAKLIDISGLITLGGRNGDCTISGSRGDIDTTMTNTELTIAEHAGAIKVAGEGGTLHVSRPAKALAVDVRRMLIDVTLGAAVPVTIITSDEALRLTLSGPPSFSLDAVATDGGAIRAADFGLTATQQDRESRLAAPIGNGGPRLVLRNRRADIVISLRK